jgi:NAD(P)-dependent dehydrogenase (short-subunit alcohol dehydrogenase family)
MQKVLITAGASGIGREIALAFNKAGARVHVLDIDASGLNALRGDSLAISTEVCDLSDFAAIDAMVPRAIESLGGLDVLINNAGIAGPTALVENYDPREWDRVMQINLGATFNVTRLAIPHLKKSSAGCIINMSSAAGRLGYPQRSAYAVSKWGVIGFTKTLSMELGVHGIRANAILPGAVAGPRMDRVLEGRSATSGRTLEEERASALANQSIKTFTEPTEIAALALFLASDAAKTISGQALSIDADMHRSA